MESENVSVDPEDRKLYELTFLQEGEDAGAVRAVLAKHGLAQEDERPLEKIRLAYPMGKRTYAFMGSLRFLAAGSLAALSGDLSLHGGIVRSLVHRVYPPNERTEGRGSARDSGERLPHLPVAEEFLTNEAIERKISEILQ